MDKNYSIRDSHFGYKEVIPKPSPEELRRYYAEKYYQEERSTYAASYCDAERQHFRNKVEQKYRIVRQLLGDTISQPLRFLDVGAGEGWALAFFHEMGWECLGLDFSDHGCRSHNPAMCQYLRVGDVFDTLKLLEGAAPFDVVLLDNVLEHVIDPAQMLTEMRNLTSSSGVLAVEVPNDYSKVQEALLSSGRISRPFWVVTPDHLSYFNKDGLTAIAGATGWEMKQFIGDFPIDFNLFNPDTNYVEDRNKGKGCHQARVAVENLIHEISPDGANRLYEALAELGLGRNITAFLQLPSAGSARGA